ncbi:MAG: PA0069 family radical SAM protein [Alphaproteobacteria bacterium GM7ARS4]|nr:PA0069 family radical SAM protein [Alphaproteobacteria bacterium GM7ARS4]
MSSSLPKKYPSRGALSNPTSRYDQHERIPTQQQNSERDEGQQLLYEKAKTILNRQRSPDIPFDYSLNPYRGCEHGCIYCYARPSHEYLGLSAGRDFERILFVKQHAPYLLQKELSHQQYQCTPIALGSNTDPYQPIEKRLLTTRHILETCHTWRQPLTITTKSHLILRDRDVLQALAQKQLVRVFISLTTTDTELARIIEPRAPTPEKRLQTIAQLVRHDIHVTLMLAPLIPALNDEEMESILKQAAHAGAQQAYYVLLRLPQGVGALWQEWLETHYPLKAKKVMHILASMREGHINDSRFHTRMRGTGPYASMLAKRFAIAKKRYRLDNKAPPLVTTLFIKPPKPIHPEQHNAMLPFTYPQKTHPQQAHPQQARPQQECQDAAQKTSSLAPSAQGYCHPPDPLSITQDSRLKQQGTQSSRQASTKRRHAPQKTTHDAPSPIRHAQETPPKTPSKKELPQT